MITLNKPKRRKYGNTWWGNAWIEALEKIDSNRLARGRTYANVGRVLDLEISATKAFATVKGRYRDAYHIEIKLKKFTEQQKNKIIQIIASYPSLGIELGIGKLPADLLMLAEKEDIKILPVSWNDIEADCSCPDWANPCKHLAATYYMLANEIDKDPFILLDLRNIERKDLKGFGVTPEIKVNNIENIKAKFNDINPEQNNKKINNSFPELIIPTFDPIKLIQLLPDNPSFYTAGNFKDTIKEIYNAILHKNDIFPFNLIEKPTLGKNIFYLELNDKALNYSELFNIKIAKSKNQKSNIEDEFLSYQIDFNNKQAFLEYFLNTSLNIDFNSYSTGFNFMVSVMSLSLLMVKAGLFIPEPICFKEGSFCIRYKPLIYNKTIDETFTKIKDLYNPTFCTYKNKFLINDVMLEIISYFITFIIHKILKNYSNKDTDKLFKAFTGNYKFAIDHFSEKNIAQSIYLWFEKINISNENISPLIKIDSLEDEDFSVSVDVINKNNPLEPNISYKNLFDTNEEEIFAISKNNVVDVVNKQLVIVSEYVKGLNKIIDSKGMQKLIVGISQMSEILASSSLILNLLGISILLPQELKKLVRPNLQLKRTNAKSSIAGLSLTDLLNFSYEIAIGDKTISIKEFKELIKNAQGLIKHKEQYLFLNPEEVQSIFDKLNEPIPIFKSYNEALFTALTGEINGIKILLDAELESAIAKLIKEERVSIPSNLNAILRPYQERGFKWLYSNTKKSLGSCIADDMGLGKTLQVITLLLQLKNETKKTLPSLVICPTTIIGNWAKECEKFAPDLKLSIFHGNKRKLDLKDIDLVITSYGTLRRDHKVFSQQKWNLLIIDEAQNIKNSETIQSKAIKSLNSQNYIAMTGTPVENRLSELWSIFDFINKGYLKDLKWFNTKFSIPIEKYREQDSVDKLKKATGPFLLRRVKTDKSIIKDLPEKIVQDEFCYLSKEQTAIYESIIKETMSQIESSEGIERKGLIFKLITSLKQVCNHPCNFHKKGKAKSDISGKAQRTMSILTDVIDRDEKVIIFTQYTKMGELLVDMIKSDLNEHPFFFHGGLNRKKRDEMVEDFQNNNSSNLMIISLKAGGTGLNLTRANHVIHYDLWWNPAVENQATDRTFRIGQTKNVMVHRLITLGTFEEKIDKIIKSKQELSDLTISTGENWITEMSNKDLKELFSLNKV